MNIYLETTDYLLFPSSIPRSLPRSLPPLPPLTHSPAPLRLPLSPFSPLPLQAQLSPPSFSIPFHYSQPSLVQSSNN